MGVVSGHGDERAALRKRCSGRAGLGAGCPLQHRRERHERVLHRLFERGAPEPPTTLSTDANETPIATDGTNVYFTDGIGDVLSVPVGGGTIKTLATGQYPVTFAVDSVNLYWTSQGDNVMQMRKP